MSLDALIVLSPKRSIQKHKLRDGQMDRQTDRWTEVLIGKQTKGWMDRHTDR